jgi:predicted DNA-binding transcriptional regulator AlpA
MAFKMYDSKEYSINEILDATGMSRARFYRYLGDRIKHFTLVDGTFDKSESQKRHDYS